MQSFSALAMPIVNSLGASGYPALQTFLSHILDRKNRFFLLSSKKIFVVLLAAATAEMLEEVFWKKRSWEKFDSMPTLFRTLLIFWLSIVLAPCLLHHKFPRFSLSKFDDINYTIEETIASATYPDLVGTYWKGSLTPNAATSETVKSSKIINYRGMSTYRLQNGKMAEMWHVIEGWPLEIMFWGLHLWKTRQMLWLQRLSL
jgi:hypothetical protein